MKQGSLVFIFTLTLCAAAFAQSNMTDSVTITTYYPAPYGVYKNMRLYPSTQPPAGSAANQPGTMYFNGTTDQIYVYTNTTPRKWQPVGGGAIPGGVIVMWSGSVANIPLGWHLCDGTNGTPDLRDRFIVGAGSIYTVGVTGGEATHTLTVAELASHTHGQTSHTHVVSQSPAAYSGGPGACSGFLPSGMLCMGSASLTSQPGGGGATSSAGSGGAHENRPPYYALAYIMKL